ncbi:MAG TPA: isocitrate lyase/phosphoenolpyruvate mutase family protein [Thermodesulfobacteriota bacterium]
MRNARDISTPNKASALRALLAQPGAAIAIGAHDALSARLAEEAGFPVVWASSFTVAAAQRAMPDMNLLTMTENLDAARYMNDAVGVPVIADCDNGYGNALNVIRTVEEYERAGIAGISVEDNVFPKRSSLYTNIRRELAPAEEHVGKIRAAKRAQRNPDFVVIARTEALIAGYGVPEALARARAYAQAGADMILLHHKGPTADEVFDFMRRWDLATPIVVVPTLYPSVRVQDLEAAGVKLVIVANHLLRAAVKAMREALSALAGAHSIEAAAPHVVPLEDIFQLVELAKFRAREAEFVQNGPGAASPDRPRGGAA